MKEMEQLINECNAFKQGQLSIEEFQKRIEVIYLPNECRNTLEKEQHNAVNKLEEITYCYTKSQKSMQLKWQTT